MTANPCPNTHREHRLHGPHEYGLLSYLDRRLLQHPPQLRPQQRFLLGPIRRRFPNPPVRSWTNLPSLPIADPKLRLLCPRTTPTVAHHVVEPSACGQVSFAARPSSQIAFS